jgi:hypothetical protein
VLLLGARGTGNGDARAATLVVVLTAGAIVHYARVRLVVEDRRSALGALLSGARFLRRHPAAALIYLGFAACLVLSYLLLLRLPPAAVQGEWLTAIAGEGFMALQLFLALASAAASTALFQSRLAHASYTAAPRLEWPESPAAEAIANLAASSK